MPDSEPISTNTITRWIIGALSGLLMLVISIALGAWLKSLNATQAKLDLRIEKMEAVVLNVQSVSTALGKVETRLEKLESAINSRTDKNTKDLDDLLFKDRIREMDLQQLKKDVELLKDRLAKPELAPAPKR